MVLDDGLLAANFCDNRKAAVGDRARLRADLHWLLVDMVSERAPSYLAALTVGTFRTTVIAMIKEAQAKAQQAALVKAQRSQQEQE